MSGRILVTILYEDSRVGSRGFGLHSLVLGCVADALSKDPFALGRVIKGIPKGGDAQLLRACRADTPHMHGLTVIAVFDEDGIRRLLRLPTTAAAAEVRGAIQQGCSDPARLSIVLLQPNLEAVLRAAAECDPSLEGPRLQKALAKDRLERDALLEKIAFDRSRRPTRACILEKVPSLSELVQLVCGTITGYI